MFPALCFLQEISPGFDRSPDPNIACGFVYCQAACPGGPTVSSSPAFRNLLGTWKSLTRALMARLGGYELHNKTTAIASVFPSFEVTCPQTTAAAFFWGLFVLTFQTLWLLAMLPCIL